MRKYLRNINKRYYLRWPFKNIIGLWFLRCILRGQADYICRPSSDLCIEAYPSSGNSFLFYLLKEINPSLRIAHYAHTVPNIRLALRFGTPIITIIRQPCEATSSICVRVAARSKPALLKYDIETALLEYAGLYNFIYKHRQNILVVDFRHLIENPGKTIEAIARFAKFDLRANGSIEVLAGRAREALGKIARKKHTENDIERLQLPVKEREEAKLEISSQIVKHPHYAAALAIYEKLKADCAV